jgi:hypothetical protein
MLAEIATAADVARYVQKMRRLLLAILTLSLAASLAACGGGSKPSAPAAPVANGISNPTAAKAAITAVYTQFFSAPIPKAMTLLQGGPTLTKAFQIANKLKGKAVESAKIDTVTITGASTANVTYDLSANGKVLLPGSDGKAVFDGGRWKVAKQTFCTLVGLGYSKPIPNC